MDFEKGRLTSTRLLTDRYWDVTQEDRTLKRKRENAKQKLIDNTEVINTVIIKYKPQEASQELSQPN